MHRFAAITRPVRFPPRPTLAAAREDLLTNFPATHLHNNQSFRMCDWAIKGTRTSTLCRFRYTVRGLRVAAIPRCPSECKTARPSVCTKDGLCAAGRASARSQCVSVDSQIDSFSKLYRNVPSVRKLLERIEDDVCLGDVAAARLKNMRCALPTPKSLSLA
jgi:hypothetical protein